MLNDEKLIKNCSYINGKWVKSEKMFSVFNPFDGKEIASVYEANKELATLAAEKAHSAFHMWKNLRPKERGSFLKKWNELLHIHWEDLATLLTLEQGKPFEQSTHELMGNNGFFNWYAEESQRVHGHTMISPDPTRKFSTWKQPVGVVGVVTPWNFPSVLPIQKCAPALAAGCTVIIKPAEDTPLSVLALAELADRADFPPGVFNVLTCHNPLEVGNVLTQHQHIKKFTFTGSTPVGKLLTQKCSSTAKNVTMELGGNCPALVFEDANLDKTIENLFNFKFYNAGQCCNNVNRFIVHKNIVKPFTERMSQLIEQRLILGNGLDKKTTLGPLINKQAHEKCLRLVKDAVSKGAKIITFGKVKKKNTLFFEPTILVGANNTMDLCIEEVFGPVIPIFSFETEKEAIEIANNTSMGLAAYLFSENIARTWRVSEMLEAGSVGINTTDVVSELLPFGGWKESGLGRENGIIGSLDPYLENKSLIFQL